MNCPYDGKVCLTREAAVRAIAHWRSQGERMDMYLCAAANAYHVGHNPLLARPRRRRARR